MIKRIITILLITANTYAGEPIRVGVLDTGLDLKDHRFKNVLCSEGHKDFTGTGLQDDHGHGTHVAGLIHQYAKDAKFCLVILKYYVHEAKGEINLNREINALLHAQFQRLTILNMSLSGAEADEQEKNVLGVLRGVIISVAAGNNGKELRDPTNEELRQVKSPDDLKVACYYPACYNMHNMHIVGALIGHNRSSSSNYGDIVKYWENSYNHSTLPNGEYGTLGGTSMATAIHTGKLIKELYDKQTY